MAKDFGVSRAFLGPLSGDSWRLHRVKSRSRWTGDMPQTVLLSSGTGGKGEGLLPEADTSQERTPSEQCGDPSPASWEAVWHSGQQRAPLHRAWASLAQDTAQRWAECAGLKSEKPRAGRALRSAETGHFEALGSHPRGCRQVFPCPHMVCSRSPSLQYLLPSA